MNNQWKIQSSIYYNSPVCIQRGQMAAIVGTMFVYFNIVSSFTNIILCVWASIGCFMNEWMDDNFKINFERVK